MRRWFSIVVGRSVLTRSLQELVCMPARPPQMAVFNLVYQEYGPFVCTIGESPRIQNMRCSAFLRPVLGTMPSPFGFPRPTFEGTRRLCFRWKLTACICVKSLRKTVSATVSLVQVRRPVKPLIDLVITSSLYTCNCWQPTCKVQLAVLQVCEYVVGKSSSFSIESCDMGLQALSATVAIYKFRCGWGGIRIPAAMVSSGKVIRGRCQWVHDWKLVQCNGL